MNRSYEKEIEIAKRALVKREKILESYENEWKRLDNLIEIHHKNGEYIEQAYREIDLKHVLKKVGSYRASVDLYKIKIEVSEELLNKRKLEEA